MSATTTAVPSTSRYASRAFWEGFWRTGGVQFVAFFVVIALIQGYQPPIGASADDLAAFYNGGRTRILLAAFLSGLNLLNLLWFTAALRTTLADAGQDGWGAAATASSAVFGALVLLQVAVSAGLAYSIANVGNQALTLALNDFAWAVFVLSAFPRTMLIMSGVFGLWRAALISNGAFALGVAAVVFGVLAGSTWLSGFWAPDGAYSRFIAPGIFLLWVLAVSRVLIAKAPAARAGW